MGLTINISYDSSVTSLEASDPTLFSEYTSAAQAAVAFYENAFTNPLTINIDFGWGEVGGDTLPSGALAASETFISNYSYSQLYSAYRQLASLNTASAVQQAAFNILPSTDPTGGATFLVATAEARALGLSGAETSLDGSVGLGSSVSWSWSQTNIAPGTFDAVGAFEHEISEVLGRFANSGDPYTLLDMFRYTAADGGNGDAPGSAAGARDEPFVPGYSAQAYSYFSYNGSTITLQFETPQDVAAGTDVADWAPSVSNDSFADGGRGAAKLVSQTDLQLMNVLGYDQAPCYCAGTLILTDRGEVEVERLAIGDNLITADGAVRPIRWIGRRSYAGRFARASHVLPICIKEGALDVDQPRRDLWISPHHAMFLDGVLIEAIDLVNGVSIIQAERVARVDYFHVELDTHDVIIAEGALSESFVDDDSRGIFQNAHEFRELYPDVATVRPVRYCASRPAFGAQVEAARRRIAQRAGIAYAPPTAARGPRALVIDSRLPQLGHDGGANAIRDHVRALQVAGFEVCFLALGSTNGNAIALSSLGITVLSMPPSGLFGDFARAHAGRFDLVYLHRVETATRCLKLARRYFDAQIVYSVADLHHLRLKGQSEFDLDHAPELMHQARDVALQELSAALSADWVITHSVSEAEQLKQMSTLAGKVRIIPWALPPAPVQTPLADRSGVAFIGSFEHAPNVDAARWLVHEIMPLVWRKAPEIQCLIIGSGLSDDLRRELTLSGVDVLGRVDDLAAVFERIRLSVAPLRFGAGLKDKVLRSLAAGLPCIGTPEALRGMEALPAALTNTCQGETASELAAAIVRLHQDESANTACAQIGLSYIGEAYNQSRIDNLMQEIARPALDRQRAARPEPGCKVLNFGRAASPKAPPVNRMNTRTTGQLQS
jgi:glycosyltransferase involved in cell wall biosynthesis